LFLSLLPQDVNLLPGYVAIDAEWAAKARNDAALANLREAAPQLFDAMTLPDAEKEVREFQGIYKGWSGWDDIGGWPLPRQTVRKAKEELWWGTIFSLFQRSTTNSLGMNIFRTMKKILWWAKSLGLSMLTAPTTMTWPAYLPMTE
ncbi:MAG: hypothetical protein LBU92_02530, partial [Prevotellaceae bacterium]|jgi:hypothetical protein|nr:hypothetical protein [Prevotellaceae bacterium]